MFFLAKFYQVAISQWSILPPFVKLNGFVFYNFAIILTIQSKRSYEFDWLRFGNRQHLLVRPLRFLMFTISLINLNKHLPPIDFHHCSCSSFWNFVTTLVILSMMWHRILLHMKLHFITNIPLILFVSYLYMFIEIIAMSLCFYSIVVSCRYIFLPHWLTTRWHWNLELQAISL